MTKFSTATDVTDVNSYALSAIEKNAQMPNTLGNVISGLNALVHSRLVPIYISIPGDATPDNPNIIKYKPIHYGMYILSSSQGGVWPGLASCYIMHFYDYADSCIMIPIHEIDSKLVEISLSRVDGLIIKNKCAANFSVWLKEISGH